ncbi:xylulokinase [Helcobacillus massiliensis]|uniref:Sugar (Pentulose or hexulose) kinase n=1 Tax=Helcobacillus massiliensis TaxID=521392 RepID=A0A839QQD9_9MICO|nr:FGGY-family carbohydrate kinase [Helcobacillus massiliensis]MBB3021878.1 sugar (pentulose or hexulose) kinase [Helcobacillus massiliensis]
MSDHSPSVQSGSASTASAATQQAVQEGRVWLGLELGSTRIKAVLIDDRGEVAGNGAFDWENAMVDGIWTYDLDHLWEGVQTCFAELCGDVRKRTGEQLRSLAGLGVSAMMHGYLAFDEDEQLLVPFRTWRNTFTTTASALLSERFGLNIPLRWSVSHLMHAALQNEEHVDRVRFLTTLAGYVHWQLSGRKVLGVGDASGMFPVDAQTGQYDAERLDLFDRMGDVSAYSWRLRDLLPEILTAGEDAGRLTDEGALLLDPSGGLRAGSLMAPPEGDAGTGMVATNSIRPGTGNVSAGTSAFAMVVLDDALATARKEIDIVATPSGDPVAMIHTNNCTGDLNAWVGVFRRFAELLDGSVDSTGLYHLLFTEGMTAPADAADILVYNYMSGEHQTNVPAGRPLMVRGQGSELSLASFMRAQLYGAFGALASGMRVLLTEEQVRLDRMFAHGGIFLTAGVAQQVLADAIGASVAVGETAGEGGAWGMAVLAAFAHARTEGVADAQSLERFLDERVFADFPLVTVDPDPEGAAGYSAWLDRYRAGLSVERLAAEVL